MADDTRVVHAGLQLLDRQLVDREGVLCGKVDDVEIEVDDDGRAYVTAILCGPGALLSRTGRTRRPACSRWVTPRSLRSSWYSTPSMEKRPLARRLALRPGVTPKKGEWAR